MEMHLRKLRMLQTCKKYGEVLRAPEMLGKKNTLIWDLTDSLVYCRIAKVGSMVTVSAHTVLSICMKLTLVSDSSPHINFKREKRKYRKTADKKKATILSLMEIKILPNRVGNF